MPRLSRSANLVLAATLVFAAAPRSRAQTPDLLQFADGDQLSGECIRIEDGSIHFLSYKTGPTSTSFGFLKDLRCAKTFAIIRKGQAVNARNAIVGHFEYKDEHLVITTASGLTTTLAPDDVALAVDDKLFLKEIAGHIGFHRGWALSLGAGGSLVRSTDNSAAINSEITLTRAIPGVDFLPRRSLSVINVRDTYDLIKTPVPGSDPFVSETHIFHAEAEHHQYFTKKFYLLGNFTFERNYSQGLLAEAHYGGGGGYTLLLDNLQQLDIKTDLHRESQSFTSLADNDVLFGQTWAVDYKRYLPHGLSFQQSADYLSAYNLPHRYAADLSDTLSIPLFTHFSLSLNLTDNYLNNPLPGLKPNSLRFSTNLTFF
jgi:hypothetical protein